MAPGDEASLDPSSMVGRVYVGNYYALLHDTKYQYRSCRPHGFRDFLMISQSCTTSD